MTQPQHIGKYEILEEIGRGGFAVVYEARDTALDRIVALKVIRNVPTDETAFVKRFQQEARTAAALNHPNIVPVYDFGDADGTLYLAMALIGDGSTLRDLLAKSERLTLKEALQILAPLAEALDYLHQCEPPLTHRDLKPANVLLEKARGGLWVVLADFGLVRLQDASTKLTKSGTILGTPAYMAPEQADSKRWGEITPLTDVYALGVIAYEILAGRVPFEGEMPTVLHAHAYEEPPSPQTLLPHLGGDLNDVLLRALAKPPAERYPTAGALVAALREVAGARMLQEKQQAELAQLLAQAKTAREAGDWLVAQNACVRIMEIDRMHPEALEMMAEATAGLQREGAEEVARRKRAQRYEEGEKALDAGQWQSAIDAFKEVAEGNPDFRDVQEKLAQARDELQRAQWYDEAVNHSEAGQWAEACRLWVQILRGRMDYRDGEAAGHLLDATGGLLGQRDKLEKWAREVTSLYDVFMVSIESEDWDAVVEKGEELLKVAPGLSGPQVWLDSARSKLLLPTALAGRYVILDKIAQGSIGSVCYKAQDKRLQNKVVAVKEISESAIAPRERKWVLESFQREAELLARLAHPNLVIVSDRFQEREHHYMVMEFIQGRTLEEMLHGRNDPFPEEQVLNWAGQLCNVLAYLHSQKPKIIYRDMKPANVMVLAGSDQVKLIDFGIARFYKPGKKKDTIEFGTDGYAPPEQYGKAQTDERSDVYALGVTLHQLLTLRDPINRPFHFPSVRSLNPKVNQQVDAAIAKAVNTNKNKRHQSIQEMWEALSGR